MITLKYKLRNVNGKLGAQCVNDPSFSIPCSFKSKIQVMLEIKYLLLKSSFKYQIV